VLNDCLDGARRLIGDDLVAADNYVEPVDRLVIYILLLLLAWRYFSYRGLCHIATGLNAEAASIAGVRVNNVTYSAFLMSGVLVGFSSLLYLVEPQGGGWTADTGVGRELLAIAAAVIGGCKITGGRFDPICITLATFLLEAVQSSLYASSLPTELCYLVFGGVLVWIGIFDAPRSYTNLRPLWRMYRGLGQSGSRSLPQNRT
jgi:ribose/xylose/arabinose/galactoside ABC-type transport system permease subunit